MWIWKMRQLFLWVLSVYKLLCYRYNYKMTDWIYVKLKWIIVEHRCCSINRLGGGRWWPNVDQNNKARHKRMANEMDRSFLQHQMFWFFNSTNDMFWHRSINPRGFQYKYQWWKESTPRKVQKVSPTHNQWIFDTLLN